ncbi:substrate-binding domain-containing protein [Thermomonospora echinospora]|uniref:substrate-binding domain-containing protein n=1 Tax=Thermomonospora echinospora TaxID=1992 RepID=UPI00135C4A2E|nr:substrate-binding domain-containing protein [Thermomonospora echinospora]
MPAVDRAITVLYEIADHGPASLADLTRRLALPKSSLLGICQSLVEERLLAQDLGGRYVLGLGLAELAAAQLQHPPGLSRLGMSVPNGTNPFYAVEIEGVRRAAAELGAEVTAVDAGQDVDEQARQLGRFVRDRVDAIVLDAVHSTAIAAAVAEAEAAGVPVIAVNVGAEGASATVTTDNVQAGQMIGRYLATVLDGKGEVAIVDGQPVTAVADRIVGFMAALRDFPGLRVVARHRGDHSPQSGERIARRLLDRHPGLSAIFAINDPMAMGVVTALVDLGVSIPVVSVDGAAIAVSSIGTDGPWWATAAQDPAGLGGLAVRFAARLRSGDPPHSRRRMLPTRLITRENIADYEPWG